MMNKAPVGVGGLPEPEGACLLPLVREPPRAPGHVEGGGLAGAGPPSREHWVGPGPALVSGSLPPRPGQGTARGPGRLPLPPHPTVRPARVLRCAPGTPSPARGPSAPQDLVVHVRDVSHPETELQKATVLAALRGLRLPAPLLDSVLEVHNKVDLVPG